MPDGIDGQVVPAGASVGGDPVRTVRGACPHDCPDTCALVYTVEQGRVTRVAGARDHAWTNGAICTKVARYPERLYSADRVLHPMRRVGPKGEGRFERIGWDEALDTIAARLRAIADSPDGPQAILPYSYAGTMGFVQSASMDRRFFHRLGASLLDRTICATAGSHGLKATLGASVGMDPEEIKGANLILIWGSNPVVSNLHFWARCQAARRRGARLVSIDPWRNETAQRCHDHIAIRPGTDAALALAMMHVLVREDLIDRDYVERFTLGFDGLRARVLERYAPADVADACGLPAERIVALARDYGTTRPAAIRLNYGLQRHAGGGMAVRTIACLPALTGAWRERAGGLHMSTSGFFPVDQRALERPDLIRGSPRTINMSTIGDALLDLRDPPVRAIVVYNANPVAVAPESRKVVAGFSRDDLFCVVLEHFLTDTADYADIVLPATMQPEHFDLHRSYGHLHVVVNHPAVPAPGETKPNSEIFRLLAGRLGFTDACFRDDDEAIARQALRADAPALAGFDWERLRADGFFRLAVADRAAPFAQGGFPTPSGRCEFFSAALQARGFDPLPTFTPPRECRESDPALAARYPLAMLSPPARNFLNSSFANLPSMLGEERTPRLEIHPADAATRGIGEGDRVDAFNDRGTLQLTACVTDRVREGVVVARSVWWRKLAPDGRNANELTSQALTDFGAAPTFYDCLVEVVVAGSGSGAARPVS